MWYNKYRKKERGIKMKIQEMIKYLAYADSDEDYVLIKKEELHKITKLAKKYLEIKKIVLDKRN